MLEVEEKATESESVLLGLAVATTKKNEKMLKTGTGSHLRFSRRLF